MKKTEAVGKLFKPYGTLWRQVGTMAMKEELWLINNLYSVILKSSDLIEVFHLIFSCTSAWFSVANVLAIYN